METLNVDCLLNIFSRVKLRERIRLELVCRRWHLILQKSCAFSDIRSIEVNKFPTTSKDLRQDVEKLASILLSVLRRCGPFVRRIDFGGRWLTIQQSVADYIANYCRRLEHLDVGSSIINADITTILLNNFETLEFFSMEDSSWIDLENQIKINFCFGHLKKLRCANLRHFTFAGGKMTSLGHNLKELNISGANGLNVETLRNLLNELAPELIVLNMCPLPALVDSEDKGMQTVLDTFAQFQQLRMLNIGYIANLPQHCSLLSFAEMRELQFLHLQDCKCVNTASLRAMAVSMNKLRTIHLIKCPNIDSYACLANVKAIRELEIRHTKELYDADVAKIASNGTLKRLRLEMCPNVTNDAVFRVVKSCTKLRELELTKCENIDENLFANAQHWTDSKELQTLSLNGTTSITTKSMMELINTKLLKMLHELDVSHNKNIDNTTIALIHVGTMANNNSDAMRQKVNKSLILYVFQTAVTTEMEERVRPEIELIF